jgi:L-lactate dehydrogenase complex protein LldG
MEGEKLIMGSRENILGRLRRIPSDYQDTSLINIPETAQPANVEMFIDKARLAGAQVDRVSNDDDARETIENLVRENNYHSIITSNDSLIRRLKLPNSLPVCNVEDIKRQEFRDIAFKAELGITSCDYGIADSGTIVIKHNHWNPRLISLAPNHHLCILEAQHIVPDRYSSVSALKNDGICDVAAITFITGISRSADIALNLVLGMHGPRKVNIIIIG